MEKDRRQLIKNSFALAGALTASATANVALASKGHQHHHKGKEDDLELIAECLSEGRLCANHCELMLLKGDTTLKDCYKAVRDMIDVCGAFEGFVLRDSPHKKALAQVCRKACEDCREECKKHMKTHKECEECFEACDDLLKKQKNLF